MLTTLDYIQTKQLNNASSSTPGGSTEPVTGLPIPTGTNSGDYVELTDAQALALSKTSVGTLYSGRYQRVKLSSGVASIALGQAVFFNASDATDPYPVTNVSGQSSGAGGTTAYDFAGVVIDPSTVGGQYCWIQATGRATVLLNGAGALGNIVGFPTSATNQFTTGTTALTNGSYVGAQLTAATGAGATGVVDITRGMTKY